MRKLVLCVIVAAFTALIPVSASAAQPVMTRYTEDLGPFAITDVCSAGISVSSHLVEAEADYFDNNGSPTRIRIHTVEVDTFTGPARTLTSDAYTYETFFTFDASGNIVSGKAVGVVLKIRLPDGSLFLSAGHVIQHPNGPIFTFVPDKGRSGDMHAFCAALGAS